jgi:transposase
MTYSIDLRERAVEYVQRGGLRTEASRIFGIDRKTLYKWLKMEDLRPKGRSRFQKRKLDKEALLADVKAYPDKLLRERAVHFGVHINAIWVALKALGVSKKNDTLQGNMPSKQDNFSA